MEGLRQTTRTILNPLNCTPSNVHLKPLSRYTMAGVPCTHNHKGSLGVLKNIPSLFSDVPVGMVENVAPKRKLDDSCLDESYETPAKKPYIPSTASPDLGLGCDSFNIDTPNSVSQQSLLERRKAVKYPNKDAIADVKINLHSECCALSEETGGIQSDGPNGCTSSPKTGILTPGMVPVNRGVSLEFKIDRRLCLSPIICNTRHPIRLGDAVDCVPCPGSRGPLAPNPTAGRQVAEGTLKEVQSTDWARDGCRASSSATSANTVIEGSDGPFSRRPLQFLSTVSGSSQPVAKKPVQVHTAPPRRVRSNSSMSLTSQISSYYAHDTK